MPNYFRNADDVVSDPDIIAAKARIGRSAFFEVMLTLAEQAENIKANSGASSTAVAANPGGSGGIFPGDGGGDIFPIDDRRGLDDVVIV